MLHRKVRAWIGDVSSAEETVESRFALCKYKVDDAFALGKMDYKETCELRVWLENAHTFIMAKFWRSAANTLGDIEFIVDGALARETESYCDDELLVV